MFNYKFRQTHKPFNFKQDASLNFEMLISFLHMMASLITHEPLPNYNKLKQCLEVHLEELLNMT